MTALTALVSELLAEAKWSFSTRRVAHSDARRLLPEMQTATSGDLILGRVTDLGSHKRIQLAAGRPAQLYEGDLVVLACGARYAPDQFEGLAEVDPEGADMLAAGGLLGRMRHRHDRMALPTKIKPLGLLARRSGEVINIADYAVPAAEAPEGLTVIGVVGASMNSGKTTAVASLAHGLRRAGHRVAAIKATGTGAFGDYNAFLDTGAAYVADFTDAGMASTYQQPLSRILAGLDTLLAKAAGQGCGLAVVELADGVFQKETGELLQQPEVRERFAGFLFAAGDALAAAGGHAALGKLGIEPAALTGMVSCSPLGTAEAEAATGAPVMTKAQLCDAEEAQKLLESLTLSEEQLDGLESAEVGLVAITAEPQEEAVLEAAE
ncbi:MAG: hypothetical protein AAFY02_02570 [Pseudomonadota bacterium]